MKRYAIFMTLIVLALTFSPASAALYDLSEHGYAQGLIYDSDSQLVWLKDANHARTTGYDADGRMAWNDAVAWAGGLDTFGYSDWRLPQFFSTSFAETASEFTGLNALLADPANSALFDNLMTDGAYWSETLLYGTLSRTFDFNSGGPSMQNINSSNGNLYAWAVRYDPDITLTTTPVPASLWLMASGVFCLLGYRRRMGSK